MIICHGGRGGSLRVIGGKWKKRRLYSPEGKDIRPTSDFVRERMFAILGDKVVGALFLDLFAGSGGVGIEALSRGAKEVYFVDNSDYAVDLIDNNLPEKENAFIFKENLPAGIDKVCKDKQFDIIFMDPPYLKNLVNRTIKRVIKYLKNDGILIVEHSIDEKIDVPEGFEIYKERDHRKIRLSFMRRNEENN